MGRHGAIWSERQPTTSSGQEMSPRSSGAWLPGIAGRSIYPRKQTATQCAVHGERVPISDSCSAAKLRSQNRMHDGDVARLEQCRPLGNDARSGMGLADGPKVSDVGRTADRTRATGSVPAPCSSPSRRRASARRCRRDRWGRARMDGAGHELAGRLFIRHPHRRTES